VLHGHIHRRYHLRTAEGPVLFGAGSATQAGREGIWVYEIDERGARAVPGAIRDGQYVLEPEHTVHLPR
jgi:hypothetical protein